MSGNIDYRKDIDGLRGWAVLLVLFFHLGWAPGGYLGVDIFFVISGYLITKIIFTELENQKFSFKSFYIRRTRRIIPLTLFTSTVALFIGMTTMLPDDLENLAQSVVATNFFSNNILGVVTITDYWDIRNDYKPLMHTWSLGIEEQFYFVYPLILFFWHRYFNKIWLPQLIFLLSFASFCLFLWMDVSPLNKFYLLQYRFWELSAGGLIAFLTTLPGSIGKTAGILLTFFGLFFHDIAPQWLPNLFCVVGACLLVAPSQKNPLWQRLIFENRTIVFLGKISFSLYMWHQIILAYSRYLKTSDFDFVTSIPIIGLILLLSIFSFRFIEQPFRSKSFISPKILVLGVIGMSFLTTMVSLWIYNQAGVLRDVPELNLYKGKVQRGIHARYNSGIYDLNKTFQKSGIRVLVIGNSFARDWANVLLESEYSKHLDLSYSPTLKKTEDFLNRVDQADFIFISKPELNIFKTHSLPKSKVWAIGEKNFGESNGIYFNFRGEDYYQQRANPESGIIENHLRLKKIWKERYLSFLDKVMDKDGLVQVFTPDKKFISQDCRHLTSSGAKYFAQLFHPELKILFQKHLPADP